LAFLEAELAMRAQAVGTGLKFCGDQKDGEAREGDGQGDETGVEGEVVLGLGPYIYGGRGNVH
jgi:hypothetical protein